VAQLLSLYLLPSEKRLGMHIFKEIAPLRAHLNTLRSSKSSIGFVPTMGALHSGHMSLVRASKAENKTTVCSIYVNPTQFGNPEDLAKYPRTLEQDLAMLEKESCDVVFCPINDEMYGASESLKIQVGRLDSILEGEFRPGHFSGVALIVSKLFHIVEPDKAYFGQKDFQQVMVVSKLVRDLNFNVDIVVMPIIREADGLAMSSRNQRLSADDRKKSIILYKSLLTVRDGLLAGKNMDALRKEVNKICVENSVRLEYLAVVDRTSFVELNQLGETGQTVLLIAAHVGSVRLIDNLIV
jgi:pantoate--beta-alanine ligase